MSHKATHSESFSYCLSSTLNILGVKKTKTDFISNIIPHSEFLLDFFAGLSTFVSGIKLKK